MTPGRFVHFPALRVPPSARGCVRIGNLVLGLHRAGRILTVAQRENATILLEDNHQLNYGDFDPQFGEATSSWPCTRMPISKKASSLPTW